MCSVCVRHSSADGVYVFGALSLPLPLPLPLTLPMPPVPPPLNPPPQPNRFYSCSVTKLPAFTPNQLSVTLAALGSLTPNRPPPPAWSAAVQQQVLARSSSLQAPGLADALWGLMELGVEAVDKHLTTRSVCCPAVLGKGVYVCGGGQ